MESIKDLNSRNKNGNNDRAKANEDGNENCFRVFAKNCVCTVSIITVVDEDWLAEEISES